ncbi:Arabinose operon regulatory protein [invertebrate metagenome]|uniref:Arabinose operon regulatory protein n=1 Tax=invertebrate metagenome TaxID=1711999 RepID=A0A2H9T7H2_9ZZZZ
MSDYETSSVTITNELHQFLSRGLSGHILFSGATKKYPKNAFLLKFSRLIVVTEGQYRTKIGQNGHSTDMILNTGDALYIPPLSWDIPDWQVRGKALTLLFGHYQTGMSLTYSKHQKKPVSVYKHCIDTTLKQEGVYLEKALTIAAQSQDSQDICTCIIEGLLRYSLKQIKENDTDQKPITYNKWRAISMYLQKHFSKEVTRESVASEYGISPNHLSRLFREEGGMGFKQYLTLVRIDRAKLLLSQYSINTSEIAARTGFHDSSYLGRVFRKQTGMTLCEYRAKYAL